MTFTCTTLRVESALMSSLDPHTDLGALIHAITSIPVSVIQIALIHALYRDGIFTMESLIIAFDSATNTENRLVEAPIYIYMLSFGIRFPIGQRLICIRTKKKHFSTTRSAETSIPFDNGAG